MPTEPTTVYNNYDVDGAVGVDDDNDHDHDLSFHVHFFKMT